MKPFDITERTDHRSLRERLEELTSREKSGDAPEVEETPSGKKKYRLLDSLERAMILHAKQRHPDLTNAQLAKDFGVSVHAVDRLIRKYRFIPPIKELLHAISHEAVGDMKRASTVAAERGDPGPAEKILIHAGEIQPIQEREGRGYGPQIVVGILPGMPVPILPEPKEPPIVIDALVSDDRDEDSRAR